MTVPTRRLAALLLMANLVPHAVDAAPDHVSGRRLPARLLECTVGRVINFDTHKEQTQAELRYDGFHRLVLFLPGIAARTGHIPDATEDAGPVDPRTRIVSDPDGIAPQPSHRFDRVIDLWPERVEMSSMIADPLRNVIVLSPISQDGSVANLFMLRASELTHFDPDHIYQGTCKVATGAAAKVRR